MIIQCPACATRYVVPDTAIGVEGRTVRCAKCRHSWFQDGPELELTETAAPADEGPPPAQGVQAASPAIASSNTPDFRLDTVCNSASLAHSHYPHRDHRRIWRGRADIHMRSESLGNAIRTSSPVAENSREKLPPNWPSIAMRSKRDPNPSC